MILIKKLINSLAGIKVEGAWSASERPDGEGGGVGGQGGQRRGGHPVDEEPWPSIFN